VLAVYESLRPLNWAFILDHEPDARFRRKRHVYPGHSKIHLRIIILVLRAIISESPLKLPKKLVIGIAALAVVSGSLVGAATSASAKPNPTSVFVSPDSELKQVKASGSCVAHKSGLKVVIRVHIYVDNQKRNASVASSENYTATYKSVAGAKYHNPWPTVYLGRNYSGTHKFFARTECWVGGASIGASTSATRTVKFYN
jgi:hypothetical protein